MKTNRLLLGAMMISAGAFSLPSFAQIYIETAPPARRVERFEARPGQVYVAGSWQWVNGKHEWVPGHYVSERRGYRYENDRWVQHDNNKWMYQRGGWAQDSDGDGVPDRSDRRPNDPTRR
jgi:hypothetical protein